MKCVNQHPAISLGLKHHFSIFCTLLLFSNTHLGLRDSKGLFSFRDAYSKIKRQRDRIFKNQV